MIKPSLLPTELHRYSLRDVALGLVGAWKGAPDTATVTLPGLGEGVPLRSARAAVIIALRALGLPPGSKVGVPLYCCPVVFKAIRAANCEPRFLDIDPATYCLLPADLRAKASSLAAVIAVHMFGNVCDMPEVLAAMAGRPVIEDCAQSLGARLEGRPAGAFGDLAFFSFRSGKVLSAGEGGALYAPEPGLRARVAALVTALPAPSRGQEIRHIAAIYVRSKLRSRPLWGFLGSRVWAAYNRATEFADKSPVVLGRIFSSDLAAVRRRMRGLDELIAAQRAHASWLDRQLCRHPGLRPAGAPRVFVNRFMYPIALATPEETDRLAIFLKDRGVGTSRPYADVAAGAAKHYGYDGDCPGAERALATTLVIPVFSALGIADLERIVKAVNEGLAAV